MSSYSPCVDGKLVVAGPLASRASGHAGVRAGLREELRRAWDGTAATRRCLGVGGCRSVDLADRTHDYPFDDRFALAPGC
jgi:hypothetical protein